MLVRMAIFRGDLPRKNELAFQEHLNSKMLPLIRDFPGIISVEALLRRDSDPSLHDFQLILDMRYADEKMMDLALASPQRTKNGEETKKLLALMINPTVEHIVLSS